MQNFFIRSINMNDRTKSLETLDATGLLCPLPVLKIRKLMKNFPTGTQFRILCDDPAAVIDIPHYCQEQGHTLILQHSDGKFLEFIIRKEPMKS